MVDKNTLSIIKSAILVYAFSEGGSLLRKDELKYVGEYVNYNAVSDRTIVDNEGIIKATSWARVDRIKILRLLARNVDIINHINVKSYNFSIKELKYVLKAYPQVIYKIGIKFEDLTKEDAYTLFLLGREDFLDKILITNYNFNFLELFEIIKAYNFEDRIINLIDFEDLKENQIVKIMKVTGDRYIDKINLDRLSAIRWIDVLRSNPKLISYCDLNIFKESDILYLVEMILIFDEPILYEVLKRRNYYKELSKLGWEKLLIHNADEFIEDCNFKKLNEQSWRKILQFHPHLIAYKH